MSERFCESCIKIKPIEEFKKYGHECRSCKIKREKESSKKYCKEISKCVCEANPKEKHEMTKGHKNLIENGYKYKQYDGEQIERFKEYWSWSWSIRSHKLHCLTKWMVLNVLHVSHLENDLR